jgi:uncharacterized protein YdhG (YjbR/CyaY superfamily)
MGEPAQEGTMSAKKAKQQSAKSIRTSDVLSEDEKAALKETARERKLEATKADWEKEVLAKIAEMPEADRVMAEKIHAIVKASAPALEPKTWYGMPAYANKDGKIVCFFQTAAKFNARYATFGFNDTANLDEGAMWSTSFALTELTATEEAKIAALVKRAVS